MTPAEFRHQYHTATPRLRALYGIEIQQTNHDRSMTAWLPVTPPDGYADMETLMELWRQAWITATIRICD